MCYCHCIESSLHLSPDCPSRRWTMRPARSGSSRGTHSSSTSRRGWIYLLPSSSSATSVFFWRRFTTRWRDARETAAPSAVAVRKLRFVVLSLCQCIAASIALVMLSIFVSWAGDHLIKYGFVIQWCNLLADDFFLLDGMAKCQIQLPSPKEAQFERNKSKSINSWIWSVFHVKECCSREWMVCI